MPLPVWSFIDCSKECQIENWKSGGHKKKCKELRGENEKKMADEQTPGMRVASRAFHVSMRLEFQA
jgi:hypothetical protein